MKSFLLNILVAGLVLPAVVLTSCKDDDAPANPIRAYVNTQTNSDNVLSFALVHTPVGSYGSVAAEFKTHLTREADQDISITFEVDEAAVAAYNAANETEYKALPASIVQFENKTLHVKAGEMVSSDTLRLSITKIDDLQEKGYLVIIKIASITGSKNCVASTNMGSVALVVTTSYVRVQAQAAITGLTEISKTGWTATAVNSSTGASFANPHYLLDGNTTNYLSGYLPIMTIDMKTPQQVGAIGIMPYSTGYVVKNVLVSTSDDGTTWDDLGVVEGMSGYTIQYIRLYTTPCRYIKIHVQSTWGNGTTCYLKELYFYK